MSRPTAMYAFVAALVVTACALLAGATPALARCAAQSITEAAARSQAVFVGTTLDRVSGQDNAFEVRASDIYKGSPGAFLEVDGADYESGFVLRSDRQYLFFVTRADGAWRVLSCGRTQPISSKLIAQADRALGPATPLRVPATPDSGPSESPSATPVSGPDIVESAAEDGDDSSTWVWVGGGVALLAGAGVVAAATRRRSWR